MNEGIAAIIAASLGAIGAAVGLIITKENKTSEFRQDWINGLRKSLSDFIGYSTKINKDAIDGKPTNSEELITLNSLRSDIILRLNNANPSAAELKLIKKMAELSRQASGGAESIHEILGDTAGAAAAVLKAEWKRVKKGEWKYRICVYVACFLALLALIVPGAYIFYHYEAIWKAVSETAH